VHHTHISERRIAEARPIYRTDEQEVALRRSAERERLRQRRLRAEQAAGIRSRITSALCCIPHVIAMRVPGKRIGIVAIRMRIAMIVLHHHKSIVSVLERVPGDSFCSASCA